MVDRTIEEQYIAKNKAMIERQNRERIELIDWYNQQVAGCDHTWKAAGGWKSVLCSQCGHRRTKPRQHTRYNLTTAETVAVKDHFNNLKELYARVRIEFGDDSFIRPYTGAAKRRNLPNKIVLCS